MRSARLHLSVIVLTSSASILATALVGCSTPPPPKPVSVAEAVRHKTRLGEELSAAVEPQLRMHREDAVVAAFVHGMALALTSSTPALQSIDPRVRLIRDVDGKSRSYVLPGNHIYLSIGTLKLVEYDNELAAALALALGHLEREHLSLRVGEMAAAGDPAARALEATVAAIPTTPPPRGTVVRVPEAPTAAHAAAARKLKWLGPGGALAFTADEQVEAAESAVGILYRAGFDPRGLISLLKKLGERPASSPYDRQTAARIVDQSRQALSEYAPLRNPITRSEEFQVIQKRIQKL